MHTTVRDYLGPNDLPPRDHAVHPRHPLRPSRNSITWSYRSGLCACLLGIHEFSKSGAMIPNQEPFP